MEKIKALLNKYQELIRYTLWGTFATGSNILTYYLC